MASNLALISSAISAVSGLNVVLDDKFASNNLKNYEESKNDFYQFLVCGPTNTKAPESIYNPFDDRKKITNGIPLGGRKVIRDKKLDIKSLHQSYLIGGPLGVNSFVAPPSEKPSISKSVYTYLFITTLTNTMITVKVNHTETVNQLKQKIHKKEGTLPDQQRLTFNGHQLEDGKSLSDYNIKEGSILHLIPCLKIGGFNPKYTLISQESLDPKYDYDFTNVNDNSRVFTRGQYEYKRPVGWNRIALKVLNKYEDNIWLGVGASRRTRSTSSCVNEWPVSYHGTEKHNFNSIADNGYLLSKGKRFTFGHGIYSTPDINIAAFYAKEFTHNGERYKMVFQNRVNPENLVRINANKTRKGGEYWISPKGEDIRPYGICIKKI